MNFDIYALITSPYVLVCVVVVLGMWLGNFKKMGSFRLGVSGPLFIGVIVGWAVYKFALSAKQGDAAYSAAQKLISSNVIPSNLQTFVLMLFIAAIGLLASKDLKLVIKKYGAKFVALGLAITLFGAALSYTAKYVNKDSSTYESAGLYTGALTSSPGLAAALESSARDARTKGDTFEVLSEAEKARLIEKLGLTGEVSSLTDEQRAELVAMASAEVGTGYAVAYPFGVIAVILGVMFIPKIFKIKNKEELEAYRQELDAARKASPVKEITPVNFDLKAFMLVCFLGYVLGAVEIKMGSLGVFSLGSTGGILLVAVFFGYIGKLGPFTFRMEGKTLGALRDISLGIYLGMVGLTYGYRVVNALAGSGLYLAISSLVIGLLSVLFGFFIGRKLMKLNWVLLSGAICGGMTSTPGLGVACDLQGSDDPAAGYAAAYPFALIGMVLFTIIMYSLP